MSNSRPVSYIPHCTCPISLNAPLWNKMCSFCFKVVYCEIWDRYIGGFVKLVYFSQCEFLSCDNNWKEKLQTREPNKQTGSSDIWICIRGIYGANQARILTGSFWHFRSPWRNIFLTLKQTGICFQLSSNIVPYKCNICVRNWSNQYLVSTMDTDCLGPLLLRWINFNPSMDE